MEEGRRHFKSGLVEGVRRAGVIQEGREDSCDDLLVYSGVRMDLSGCGMASGDSRSGGRDSSKES